MTGWLPTSRGRRKVLRIAAILSAVVVLALSSCDKGASASRSLQRHGLDVVSLMAEMLSSEAYRQFAATPRELEEILAQAGGGDYSQPVAIYQITFPPNPPLLDMLLGITNPLSPALKDHLADRTQSALATRVNAQSGAKFLAAAGLCSAGKTFVHPQLTERTSYLYTFEQGLPALISFIPGEDGSVSASGSLIFSGEMTDEAILQRLEDFMTGILEIQELAVEER